MDQDDIEGSWAVIVYANGCSYACISNGKRYSDFLGEYFNCKSINAALPGSCNSRILRSSLRDLIELKKSHDNIIAVISLSFILRTELWHRNPKRQDCWKQSGDGDFISFQFAQTIDWKDQINKNLLLDLEEEFKSYGKNWLTWFNVEAETTKLLEHMILFASWCKLNNIKYVIFSGPLQEPIELESIFVKSFYDTVCADNLIINIFNESFLKWCNDNGHTPIDDFKMVIHGTWHPCGHQGEDAHKAWAKYLIENYLGNLS